MFVFLKNLLFHWNAWCSQKVKQSALLPEWSIQAIFVTNFWRGKLANFFVFRVDDSSSHRKGQICSWAGRGGGGGEWQSSPALFLRISTVESHQWRSKLWTVDKYLLYHVQTINLFVTKKFLVWTKLWKLSWSFCKCCLMFSGRNTGRRTDYHLRVICTCILHKQEGWPDLHTHWSSQFSPWWLNIPLHPGRMITSL